MGSLTYCVSRLLVRFAYTVVGQFDAQRAAPIISPAFSLGAGVDVGERAPPPDAPRFPL
jgi:hypothetical protein